VKKQKLYASKAWLQSEMIRKSVEDIAKDQGVSVQTIYNWARQHGLIQ
jgi:uncharacterized protein YjcR